MRWKLSFRMKSYHRYTYKLNTTLLMGDFNKHTTNKNHRLIMSAKCLYEKMRLAVRGTKISVTHS